MISKATIFAVILVGFVSALCLRAESVPKSPAKYQEKVYLCRNHKIVRTLRLTPASADKECEAVYTKAGVDKSIGSGRNTGTCQRFIDNVRGNLKTAGWHCRDISSNSKTTAAPGITSN